MNIRQRLIVVTVAGFSAIAPSVFAQTPAPDADSKKPEQQQQSVDREKRLNQYRDECRRKAADQMIDGNRMRTFMGTCIEQAFKDAKAQNK